MIELSGSERLVTMTIGHFTWCIVAALVVGSFVSIIAMSIVRSTRPGDDQ